MSSLYDFRTYIDQRLQRTLDIEDLLDHQLQKYESYYAELSRVSSA